MHFTLFQVLAGITRLPHCCVTLALPLCLPIMSYYKLQRPEFNKDNLTPTYNTILNTDGTVRSPKGKGMRAAADSDVIQRHIVLGAEFLQLKKAKYIVSCIIITIKIESASGVSTSELTSAEHICITARSCLQSGWLLKAALFLLMIFFSFITALPNSRTLSSIFISLFEDKHSNWKFISDNVSPPQRKSLPLLLAHCFTHPCSFISYRSIQNTFSLLTDEALPDNRLGTKTISAHADSNCSTFQYIQRSSGFAFSKAPNRY